MLSSDGILSIFFRGFGYQKIHLGVPCAIIDIDDIILSTSGTMFYRPAEIRVYELKWR